MNTHAGTLELYQMLLCLILMCDIVFDFKCDIVCDVSCFHSFVNMRLSSTAQYTNYVASSQTTSVFTRMQTYTVYMYSTINKLIQSQPNFITKKNMNTLQ